MISSALLSLEEAKTWLGLSNDDEPEKDVILENWINSASEFINNYTGQTFIYSATATNEIFDGTGAIDYFVCNRPIVAVTGVYYWNGTGWTVTTSTYDKVLKTGKIYFTDGSKFGRGSDNWKVAYTFGYTLINVPFDLKEACLGLVMLRKKQFDDGIHGVSSRNFGDQSVSYSFGEIPNNIKMTLNKYKPKRVY
jgi:hypothetical protein